MFKVINRIKDMAWRANISCIHIHIQHTQDIVQIHAERCVSLAAKKDLVYGAEQVVYSGYIRDFSWKTTAGNEIYANVMLIWPFIRAAHFITSSHSTITKSNGA